MLFPPWVIGISPYHYPSACAIGLQELFGRSKVRTIKVGFGGGVLFDELDVALARARRDINSSRGKSTFQRDMLELALARGRSVAVVRNSGTLVYRKHAHLTSITPLRERPLDLWLDEVHTFERIDATTGGDDDDLPPVPRAA